MKHILITGGGGFLGPYLAEEARRAFPRAEILVLRRRHCDLSNAPAVRALIARQKPDIVFHLAGMTRPARWSELFQAHVTTTENLLDALMLLPHREQRTVVIAGSSLEYGSTPEPATERHTAQPVSPYAVTKLYETLIGVSYNRFGLDVRIARVFNTVGPGMPAHLAVGSFAQQIARIEEGLQKPVLKTGDLGAERDYVDVRDVAKALVRIARAGRAGQIYNVCSGRSSSLKEVVRKLLTMTPARIRTQQSRARLRFNDPRRVLGNKRKITAETGWKPTIPMSKSLEETLQWHRQALRN